MPGERDALLLSAGELVGVAVGVVVHLDELQHFGDAGGDRVFVLAADLQRECDVAGDGQVWPDRVGLEHDAEVALFGGHLDACGTVDERLVAASDGSGVGCLEAGDAHECGGFAAARGPQQGDEFFVVDGERYVVEDGGRAEGFVEPMYLDVRHGESFARAWRRGPAPCRR